MWPEQPAPPDHPWRKMPRHAMTPHYSGDTIDAQVSHLKKSHSGSITIIAHGLHSGRLNGALSLHGNFKMTFRESCGETQALHTAVCHCACSLEQSLSTALVHAQHRIAAGVKQMLQLWFERKPFPEEFYIVREGKLAEQYT